MQELIGYIFVLGLAGAFSGFLAGLFGIGGGLVVVPVLYHLLSTFFLPADDAMAMAVATSLATILPTALSSFRSHHRLSNVEWQVVLRFAPFLVVGAIVGGINVANVSGVFLKYFFSALLVLMAIKIFRPLNSERVFPGLLQRGYAAVISFWVGLISAMAGIGGGAIGSPVLMVAGLSPHKAVGTASSFGFLIALPAVLSILLFSTTPPDSPQGCAGLICLPAFVVLAVMSTLLAPVGAKLGKRLSPSLLKKLLASLMVLIAFKMVLPL